MKERPQERAGPDVENQDWEHGDEQDIGAEPRLGELEDEKAKLTADCDKGAVRTARLRADVDELEAELAATSGVFTQGIKSDIVENYVWNNFK